MFEKESVEKEDKRRNRDISSDRVLNEHAIGFIKRFNELFEKADVALYKSKENGRNQYTLYESIK